MCPWNDRSCFAVVTSHTRTVLSSPGVAGARPSNSSEARMGTGGDNASASMPWSGVAGGRGAGKRGALRAPDDLHSGVPHKRTARIQEVHLLVLHCLCDGIDFQLSGGRG